MTELLSGIAQLFPFVIVAGIAWSSEEEFGWPAKLTKWFSLLVLVAGVVSLIYET